MLLAEYKELPLYRDLFSMKRNTTRSTVHCYCTQNCSSSESAQQLHLNAQVSKYSRCEPLFATNMQLH